MPIKKIMIVGCARSGTTLLHSNLGAHRDVHTLKETHFFQKIRRPGIKKILDYILLSKEKSLRAYDFIKDNNPILGEYDINSVHTLLSAVDFFINLFNAETALRGKSAWIEKTPTHLFSIPLISFRNPDVIFVHSIRDGKDVVASLVDASKKYSESRAWKAYSDLSVAIETFNRAIRTHRRYLGRDGHIFVQYEDIISEPKRIFNKIYKGLGLEFEGLNEDFDQIYELIVREDEGWKTNHQGQILDTRNLKFDRIFDDVEKERIISEIDSLGPSDQPGFI